MAYRFKGGLKLAHQKHFTEAKPIVDLPLPELLIVPLQQHLGAPAKAVVKKGDIVLKGQLIGQPGGFVSAMVHAPTSGTVKAVDTYPHPILGKSLSVAIEPDGEDKWVEGLPTSRDWKTFSPTQIREAVQEAGIVGMGGATFPTHVKLAPPETVKIDTVLINGAECEPYLTSDHAAMREFPDDLIIGTQLIMQAVGAKVGYIGIEENKQDVIALLTKKLSGTSGLSVASLPTKYPQGAERSLIHAILDRHLPAGKLPMEVGVVVQNANTAISIADAVIRSLPVTSKVVTVTGACVTTPQNIRVRIGTPIEKLFEACGGFNQAPAKIIMGGPMMGQAQYSLDVPIVKGTSGLLALTQEEVNCRAPRPCIRCGRCVAACPMGLVPADLAQFAEKGLFEMAERNNVLDCVECGCCTYSCPSTRPLVHNIRMAKVVIREMIAKRKKATI
jgi:electron transport complex protein RnfC